LATDENYNRNVSLNPDPESKPNLIKRENWLSYECSKVQSQTETLQCFETVGWAM